MATAMGILRLIVWATYRSKNLQRRDFIYDISLDNRYGTNERYLIDDERFMMLVPDGANNLERRAFGNMDIDYCVYTHSIGDFYVQPK